MNNEGELLNNEEVSFSLKPMMPCHLLKFTLVLNAPANFWFVPILTSLRPHKKKVSGHQNLEFCAKGKNFEIIIPNVPY